MSQQTFVSKAYELITDEGEERTCESISEKSCKETPGNFFKNVFSGSLSKLAEQLVSPGTTLPWILAALGVPNLFTGALVPIKDAGSLLPQLFVSAKIRAYAVRKWFWVIPALIQALALFTMAFVVFETKGSTAGILILSLLLLFSLASGVASISFKDVIGKTIPKGKRGQLLAVRSTIGGILTLAAGVFILQDLEGRQDHIMLFWLVMSGAILWVFSAFLFALIAEEKGATEGGRSPINEIKHAWKFWKEDSNLRRFIFTRGLLMAIPLAQPFFVVLGKEELGSEVNNLGVMVIAAGIANIISSPFWGRFADQSSRKLMVWVSVLGMVNISLMALFPFWPESLQNIYTFAVLFLIQVMAHGGARLSRKTYLVDFAPEKERPLYVSLSNTMIGIFTLIAAGLGSLSSFFGIQAMLFVFVGLLGLGLFLALKLKEV
ncbi:MFS-type transporter involved in bile tolerance, Atg22 family [Aquiflexum balticum DSM 16537]|uniref:MFS-type transporter involved in bile tolerance, Atg22 family n=1 Tax=Aquiflexum balticum DSM 16537 TaxID=758820 RepID=A0A1W2H5U2_9BACT|nr:MFS transporter [Aquiflexum balticum]SMD44002.1 MFS-type transporter involved in bile tolerance, Atg22 family [Aquiflexum balticum DSM 16537]